MLHIGRAPQFVVKPDESHRQPLSPLGRKAFVKHRLVFPVGFTLLRFTARLKHRLGTLISTCTSGPRPPSSVFMYTRRNGNAAIERLPSLWKSFSMSVLLHRRSSLRNV